MTAQINAAQIDSLGIWVVNLNGAALGLSNQCEWAIKVRSEILTIIEPRDMVFALPILELGRLTFYTQLQAISNGRPDIAKLLMAFPEELLVRCAFETSVSDYWPLKGLEWLISSPHLVSHLGDKLDELKDRPWATQNFRHKLRAIIRRGK